MSHWRPVTQAVAATIITPALVAGVPYALVRGVTWPALQPTLETLRYGQATPDLLIAMLAVIVWVAWAQLTLSLVVEIAATARGTVASRVAVLGIMQPVAARLISAVLLLSSAFGARPAAAMPPPAAAVAAVIGDDPANEHPTAAADRPDATDAADLERYEVRRGDTLWGIAERHLGDGRRWREIRDVNAGRPQPDGRSLAANGDAIDVGWTLLLPRSSGSDSDEDAARVVVEPGDTLSRLAGEHMGDSDDWRVLFSHNRGRRQPDGDRLTDPDRLQPGWRIDIPKADRPDDRHDEPVRRQRGPKGSDDLSTRRDGNERAVSIGGLAGVSAQAREDQYATAPTPNGAYPADDAGPHAVGDATQSDDPDVGWWWIVAAGMVAAGVAATLTRLSRLWQRRRRFGERLHIPPTPDEALHAAGTSDTRTRACLAVRAFAATVTDPTITGVTIDVDGTVALLLDDAAPDQLPDGWFLDAFDPRVAELPPHVPDDALEPAAAMITAAASTLVTVGVGVHTGQLLMLALEALQIVALSGDPTITERTMLTWALELATSEHAAALDIWLVGFDLARPDTADEWERIHCMPTAADAITGIQRLALGNTDNVTAWPTRRDDDWIPQIILCAPDLAAPSVQAMQTFADGHRDAGIIIVTADNSEATGGWRLAVADDAVTVTSLQQPVTLQPVHRITRDEFTTITGMVAAAKHTATGTVAPAAQPAASDDPEQNQPKSGVLLERLVAPDTPLPDTQMLPDNLVVVRLLGPVAVETPDGHTAPSGMLTHAIAHLACHRHGVSADRLIDALWDGRAVDRQRLAELISRARAALGGADRIPRARSARGYQITDTIVTDIELLGWWIRRAQRDPDTMQHHLTSALGLVNGRPFSDVDWPWATFEGLAANAAATICDVTTVLATWHLEHHDPAGALHAVQQARKAAPESEQLARIAMRAHYQRAETDQIRAVMADLRAVTDNDAGPDGDDQLHPDTIALYRTLTSNSASPVG